MELAQRVKRLRQEQNLSWRETGKLLGITGALAWKVGHGKCDNEKARQYFDMPPKGVEVIPCKCGQVHQFKSCPNERKQKQVDRMAARLDPIAGGRIRARLKVLGFSSITEYWLHFLNESI